MYLQNELLLASPLALYVCLRLRSLVAGKALKNVATAMFVLLAAGYPLAESLSHGSGDGWERVVIVVGYCALPMLLYLVMTVIAGDIAVWVFRLGGAVSKEAVRSTRFRRLRLAAYLVVPALVVAYGIVNNNVLRVSSYRVEVPRRASAVEGLTVVFMSDLHFRSLTTDRLLDRLVDKVNAQKPDLILLGGDLLEGDRRDEATARYERAFRRMVSTYGIYGCPGNHERFSRAGTGGFLERAGIRLLQDEVVSVDRAVALAGRRDGRSRNRKSVPELLASAPDDLPVILLAHRPVEFDEAVRAGVDVQLSGHTHAGQLFPVNLITRRQYDLNWGHVVRGRTHFFVTSGLQVWGPPVRTAGVSEILVLRLSFTAPE